MTMNDFSRIKPNVLDNNLFQFVFSSIGSYLLLHLSGVSVSYFIVVLLPVLVPIYFTYNSLFFLLEHLFQFVETPAFIICINLIHMFSLGSKREVCHGLSTIWTPGAHFLSMVPHVSWCLLVVVGSAFWLGRLWNVESLSLALSPILTDVLHCHIRISAKSSGGVCIFGK